MHTKELYCYAKWANKGIYKKHYVLMYDHKMRLAPTTSYLPAWFQPLAVMPSVVFREDHYNQNTGPTQMSFTSYMACLLFHT